MSQFLENLAMFYLPPDQKAVEASMKHYSYMWQYLQGYVGMLCAYNQFLPLRLINNQ